MSELWTILRVLGWTQQRFKERELRTPRLDAEVLLAHVLHRSRVALYTHHDQPLAPEELVAYRELIKRRLAGEPVAYLVGKQEFWSLELAVDPRVLVPRPETEGVVEAALAALKGRPAPTVVDVGTGSGAIAVALAVRAPRLRVIATDISSGALAVARVNAAAHGAWVDFREGDLLAPVTEGVDIVAANLPYLREDALGRLVGDRTSLAFEPRLATVAGPDGLALVRRAIADLPRVLAPDGAAFFECDPPQVAEISALLAPLGRVDTLLDLAGLDRVVRVLRR